MPRGIGWVIAALVVAYLLLARKSAATVSKAPGTVAAGGAANQIGVFTGDVVRFFGGLVQQPDQPTMPERLGYPELM